MAFLICSAKPSSVINAMGATRKVCAMCQSMADKMGVLDKIVTPLGENLMDVDSKSQSFYLEEIQENTDDLLISKNSKYFKFSLESAGLSLGGILVATMVEDELEHLYMTIVTKHLKVLSVEWDLSKNNLLDGLKIRDVTGNHEYYSDWPQTCVALELQRESCASKIAV